MDPSSHASAAGAEAELKDRVALGPQPVLLLHRTGGFQRGEAMVSVMAEGSQ